MKTIKEIAKLIFVMVGLAGALIPVHADTWGQYGNNGWSQEYNVTIPATCYVISNASASSIWVDSQYNPGYGYWSSQNAVVHVVRTSSPSGLVHEAYAYAFSGSNPSDTKESFDQPAGDYKILFYAGGGGKGYASTSTQITW